MNNHYSPKIVLLLLASAMFAIGNPAFAQTNFDAQFQKMMAQSFRSEGIASVNRIEQDETQQFCSNTPLVNSKRGAVKALEIQKKNMASIIEPQDGRFLGDWKKGELIAQSGRGSTWSDSAEMANGGGCYNCHQIDIKEISYGTIGPSLWNYGKRRGYSQEVVAYTWKRIANSKAFNACSAMPRFGHFKLLTQEQMQDVMALLLDPNSPVNQ